MINRLLIYLSPIYLSIMLYGCVPLIAAGAGGILAAGGTAVWLNEKLSQEFDVDYDRAVSVTKKTLTGMKLEIEKETRTDEMTQLISKYTDGKTIWIDIHHVADHKSRIEIRVGVPGDEASSQKILNEIKRWF